MNEGEIIPADIPRARRAHYDPTSRFFTVDLTDGRDFTIPVVMYLGLNRLTDDEIEFFEIIKDGTAIRWERYDLEIPIKNFAARDEDNIFARMCADDEPLPPPEKYGPLIEHGGPNTPGSARDGKRRKDRHA